MISSVVEFGKTHNVTTTLPKRVLTDKEIIDEFTTKAAGVWKAKVPNSPDTGWLKITAGSSVTDGKGKALIVTVRAQGLLEVANKATGEIIMVSADPATRRQNEKMGSVSVGTWENGQVVIDNKFMRLVYERGVVSPRAPWAG